MLKKITEFNGYLSGDGACFCLDKNPDEIDSENFEQRSLDTSYPDDWFPKVDRGKKFSIKIIVQLIEDR